MRLLLLLAPFSFAFFSCKSDPAPKKEAQTFLDAYTAEYLKLRTAAAEAEWAVNTKIVEGDTTNAHRLKVADEALAMFAGSKENIKRAQQLLEKKDQLTELQRRQLDRILYLAANKPATVPEIVKARIAAEAVQTEKLFGFNYQLNNKPVSTNEIDQKLVDATDADERLEVWLASKEVGKPLRDGIVELRRLRNETVQALGYNDYFTYQVSDYGMNVDEMMTLCRQLVDDVMPLYRELHTYARHTLAEKYGQPVPEYLPAHWLPNRWGQDWGTLVEVEGIDLDSILMEKGDEWQIMQAERFYISLGFDPLPKSFYKKSSLYPLPPDAGYKKNNHASAWHMDLQDDVRCLMSVVPNARWYETTHHELGHIYYYLAYSTPEVPHLLRGGANRAFHEAIGSQLGLAAMQKPFLAALELIPENVETDDMQTLLKEALNYIVFIPWAAGVMTEFEHDLYKGNLPPEQFNERWWALKKKYQGIVPPVERGPEYCDPATKTHINDDAAQYYDYALSYALLFQFHDHIAKNILRSDPRATNYFGNKEVGSFLMSLLSKGATEDWQQLLQATTGESINAKAMLSYFEPLMEYLRKENLERQHVL